MFWTFGIAISSKRFRIPVKWFDTIYTKRTTASRSPAFCFLSRNSQHVYLCRSADGNVANFLRLDKSWFVCRYESECESFTISNSQALFSSFACRNLVAWVHVFLNYFVPFVEIDVWYKFVHNLLISERISNITRHKCSKFSALQYHKSDSRYQSNDLTPYIQSAPRRRAVQHCVF